MGRFTYATRRNPCPICEEIKTCRWSDGLILCHSHPDYDPGHPEYRWDRTASNGVWGVFYPRKNQWGDDARWREKQSRRRREREEREREREMRSLPPWERDREIREILSQLDLSPRHRKALLERGMTEEQIAAGGYRSIRPYQVLRAPVNPRLAGVNDEGERLTNQWGGILIPVPDGEGHYVGFQYRLLQPQEGGKYRWLSSSDKSPHIGGEMPLGVYYPPNFDPNRWDGMVGLCESVGFKPAIASHRLERPVIGGSGGNFTPRELRRNLAEIARRTGRKATQIVLYPDAGSRVNPSVLLSYRKAIAEVKALGYKVAIADWGQADEKRKGWDIDEVSLDLIKSIRLVKPSDWLPTEEKKAPKLIEKALDLLSRRKRKPRTEKKQTVYVWQDGHPFPSPEKWEGWGQPIIEYPQDIDHAKVHQAAIAAGWKNILNNSATGSGKSHSVAQMANAAGKIWYFSQDHRNPSISEIELFFKDLNPRSQFGFYRDQDGKLRKATEEMAEARGSNCINAGLFDRLQKLGYDPNEKEGKRNAICSTCPILGKCASSPDGYLYERRQTLAAPFVRADLRSYPRDYNNRSDIHIFDDVRFDALMIRSLTTDHGQLLKELDHLEDSLSEHLLTAFSSLRKGLRSLFGQRSGKYGLESEKILDALKDAVTPEQLEEFIAIVESNYLDLGEIFAEPDQVSITEAKREGISGSAAKMANRYLRGQTYKETLSKLEKLPSKALLPLLKLLRGDRGIVARLWSGNLIFTIEDRGWYSSILNRAKANIFLDATIDSDRLTMQAGLDDPILTIKQQAEKPLSNLTIEVIRGEGWGSNDISDVALDRAAVVMEAIDPTLRTPILTHKAVRERLQGTNGHWFRDNRGSNDFQGQNLIILGTPAPNLGAIADQYLAITGSLDGFESYYAQLIDVELIQAAGRIRANRYPDRRFTLYLLIGETTPLDPSIFTELGATVTEKAAVEYSPDAGNRWQSAIAPIVRVIQETGATTLEEIGAKLGKTRQAISKALQQAGVTVKEIAEKLSTGPIGNHIGSVDKPEPDENDLINQDWYRYLLGLSPLELLDHILEWVQDCGVRDYIEAIADLYPSVLAEKIVSLLYLVAETG